MSNEDSHPNNLQKNDAEKSRTLVIHLPEGSAMFNGTNMHVDKLNNNLFHDGIEKFMTPLPPFSGEGHAALNGLPEPDINGGKKYRVTWMHATNIFFVVFVTLTALFPAFLSQFFGIAIFASNTNVPNAQIHRNDILISKVVPAQEVSSPDIILLHGYYSWAIQIRKIVATSISADSMTIESVDGIHPNVIDSYTLDKATPIHVVLRKFPRVGYTLIIFTSVLAKILGGLVLIIVNLLYHLRKARKRSR